jgi:hypothetical protein
MIGFRARMRCVDCSIDQIARLMRLGGLGDRLSTNIGSSPGDCWSLTLIGLVWFRVQMLTSNPTQDEITQNVSFSAQTATSIIQRATETELARIGIDATLTLVRQTATEAPESVRLNIAPQQTPFVQNNSNSRLQVSDSQATATAIIANATATQSYIQYSTAQAAGDIVFLGTHEARIELTQHIIDTATAEYVTYNAT